MDIILSHLFSLCHMALMYIFFLCIIIGYEA